MCAMTTTVMTGNAQTIGILLQRGVNTDRPIHTMNSFNWRGLNEASPFIVAVLKINWSVHEIIVKVVSYISVYFFNNYKSGKKQWSKLDTFCYEKKDQENIGID